MVDKNCQYNASITGSWTAWSGWRHDGQVFCARNASNTQIWYKTCWPWQGHWAYCSPRLNVSRQILQSLLRRTLLTCRGVYKRKSAIDWGDTDVIWFKISSDSVSLVRGVSCQKVDRCIMILSDVLLADQICVFHGYSFVQPSSPSIVLGASRSNFPVILMSFVFLVSDRTSSLSLVYFSVQLVWNLELSLLWSYRLVKSD